MYHALTSTSTLASTEHTRQIKNLSLKSNIKRQSRENMRQIFLFILLCFTKNLHAIEPSVPMQTWVNQAIVNVYTFSYKDWKQRQKDMAAYFTPDAWKAFLAAMNQSNMITQTTKSQLTVSAVATLPPTIKSIGKNLYEAQMPILVSFTGSTGTEVQHLTIKLHVFKTENSGFGEFAINQFEASIDKLPCSCENDKGPKVTIV